MGHYCEIEFAAKLTYIGVEIVEHFQTHTLLETAEYFPIYSFLEACYNRYSGLGLERFPTDEFDMNAETWKVKWEHKIKCFEQIFMFLLPYMILEDVEFIYSSEHGDWKKDITKIFPTQPKIDLDRKFGEATGIEWKKL